MRLVQSTSLDPSFARCAEREAAPTPWPCRANAGVLVVDDDPMVRTLVQLVLDEDNFTVWPAAGGREAILLYGAHRERIDLALLDVRMPDLDGPHTLDGLRALNPNLLACFMTGDVGAYEPEELRRRGAAHVIAKPFHIDELAQTLRRLLEGVSVGPMRSDGGDTTSARERNYT